MATENTGPGQQFGASWAYKVVPLAAARGPNEYIPGNQVDVYVPGCPPRPEQLIEGIFKLREKILKQELKFRGLDE